MILRCRFPIASRAGKFWAVAGLLVALFPHAALSQSWPTTDWEPACSGYYGSGVCDLDDVGVEVFLLQLKESSGRLEAMGFPAPALDTLGTSPDAYPVYFFEEDLTLPPGKSFAGFYDILERRLDVDYTEYFAMNTHTYGNIYAPSHELFHAIQYSYPEMLRLRALGNWVLEGTAIAAELFLSDMVEHRVGLPWLDTPLDALGSSVSEKYWPYVSYPFWLHIVDAYGGGGPDGFGVLHDFLADIENQAGQSSAIAMVDGALRTIDAEGLYDIYPGFIARYGADPQHYEGVVDVPVRPTGGFTYTTTTDGTVDPVSAQAFLVEVVGILEQQDSRASNVEIRLKADDPDALHLIVGDTRYDGSGADRNVYSADIAGEVMNELLTHEKLFVRVVNVARDPAAYQPQDFELIVTVYHEYIFVNGTGWSSGGGPSNEAIDSPITFPAQAGEAYWGPGVFLDANADDTSGACALSLGVNGHNGSQGGLSLVVSGPLSPGRYAIAKLPTDRPFSPFASTLRIGNAGMVITSFFLTPGETGNGSSYLGQDGTLTIETITPRWITGSAHLFLEIDQFWENDYSGPHNVELELDFSVPNTRASRLADVAPCIGT